MVGSDPRLMGVLGGLLDDASRARSARGAAPVSEAAIARLTALVLAAEAALKARRLVSLAGLRFALERAEDSLEMARDHIDGLEQPA